MKTTISLITLLVAVAICVVGRPDAFRDLIESARHHELPDFPPDVGIAPPASAAQPASYSAPDLFLKEVAALGGDGVNYFIDAAARGDLAKVETLLGKGMPADVRDADGRTALLCAAAEGRLAMVRRLVTSGADVNAHEKNGCTALIASAAAGETEVAAELLKAGAKINEADPAGRTALHYALAARKWPVMSLLVAQGADCAQRDGEGKNAVVYAFETGEAKAVEAVLAAQKQKLEWNQWTRATLLDALEHGDKPIIRLLLAKHQEPTGQPQGGQPLLAYAIAQNDLARVKLLLECGGDANVPLRLPAEKEFVKLLSGQMLPSYVTTEKGLTPLMLAAGLSRVEMMQALLAHGANRNAYTPKSKLMALTFAAWVQSTPGQLVLLGKNPDLSQQEQRVEISLKAQRAYLFNKGRLALSSPISTGKPGYRTPPGSYVITDKNRSHISTIYKVAMPFFMRLSGREFGMHAGVVPNYPASHGCIRMPGDKARELFQQVDVGTLVTIN